MAVLPHRGIESWAAGIIGAPFVDKGRSRTGLDCYGTVWLWYLEGCGVELPSFTSEYASARAYADIVRVIRRQQLAWPRIKAGSEQPGDIILLRLRTRPIHVGLVWKSGHFIHATADLGVCSEEYGSLAWDQRVLGFYRPVPA
jgi:cell wall-associated NlpC family hydrolase